MTSGCLKSKHQKEGSSVRNFGQQTIRIDEYAACVCQLREGIVHLVTKEAVDSGLIRTFQAIVSGVHQQPTKVVRPRQVIDRLLLL